jgi:hypothetical protein
VLVFMFVSMAVGADGSVVHPPDDTSMESHSGVILTGETEEPGEKPVPVPLCLPQITHGLAGSEPRPPR